MSKAITSINDTSEYLEVVLEDRTRVLLPARPAGRNQHEYIAECLLAIPAVPIASVYIPKIDDPTRLNAFDVKIDSKDLNNAAVVRVIVDNITVGVVRLS